MALAVHGKDAGKAVYLFSFVTPQQRKAQGVTLFITNKLHGRRAATKELEVAMHQAVE